MNILIVEDEPNERELLEEQIRGFGYDTASCATATAALQVCQQTHFSLILLDLGLPDMDGVDLCRQIRSSPQGNAGMILVITGRDKPGDLQQSLEAGADDYLMKPVSAEQLRGRLTIMERRLHNEVRRRQTEKALSESLTQIERAKQEWESTADSLSLLICLLDSRGHIIRANRTVEHWNLGNVLNIKGRDVHTCLHPTCQDPDCYLKRFLRTSWETISEGKTAEYEVNDHHLHRPLKIQLRPISTAPRKTQQQMESIAILEIEDVSPHHQLQEILSQQDRLLLGVAGAMDHLLVTADFHTAVTNALQTLGLAMNIDRVSIFESHGHPETKAPLISQRFEWNRFSGETQMNAPGFQDIAYSIGLERWYDVLKSNNSISGLIRDLPPEEQEFLAPQNIMSILLVPIMIHDQFWGFIGFDDCHSERQWREEEEAVLFAMAGSIGGAIARQQVEEQLQQTSSELRAVFQSLPDEYFRLGADGNILDYKVNQGSDLLHPDTFIGKWASGLLPEKIERQFDKAIAQVLKTKKLVSIEYRVPTSDRKPKYEEIRLLPFLDDQLIVVARDITDRKLAEKELRRHRDHLEELVQKRTAKLTETNQHLQQEIARREQTEAELRELNQKLEEASQHKSRFLASMSHELRTPLNAMLGYTSLTLNALKGTLPPKHLSHLTRAEHSARLLLQLINDVLDFSKIEAGEMEIVIEEIALLEVLEDVKVIAEGLLLGKSVELHTQIDPHLPVIVSDYTKIKQLLNNLVGNAIKFTHEGSVTIRAYPAKEYTTIHIDIEDTGEGIPEEKIAHIFESFKQADASVQKQFGGTGLGLAITKQFCDMLGIDIGVQSQVGQGTTFWLEIPVEFYMEDFPQKPDVSQIPHPPEEATGADYRSILLIDDDEATLILLKELFIHTDHIVYTARSGQQGITLAREHKPEVILVDLVMPGMDGFETTRQLKQDSRTVGIPVIACSAVATKEFQKNAMQAGCIGYIAKPIEPERLLALVKRYVAASRA